MTRVTEPPPPMLHSPTPRDWLETQLRTRSPSTPATQSSTPRGWSAETSPTPPSRAIWSTGPSKLSMSVESPSLRQVFFNYHLYLYSVIKKCICQFKWCSEERLVAKTPPINSVNRFYMFCDTSSGSLTCYCRCARSRNFCCVVTFSILFAWRKLSYATF